MGALYLFLRELSFMEMHTTTTDTIELRKLTHTDEAILWPMLALAAHEPLLQTVRDNPQLACYVNGWGRAGDFGYAATDRATGECMGAAWLRLWPGVERGFAYIDESIPELAMAVADSYRGQGIGTKLLRRLLTEAPPVFSAIALSVRTDNPVIKLYERTGFEILKGSGMVNRTGGTSVTMLSRR